MDVLACCTLPRFVSRRRKVGTRSRIVLDMSLAHRLDVPFVDEFRLDRWAFVGWIGHRDSDGKQRFDVSFVYRPLQTNESPVLADPGLAEGLRNHWRIQWQLFGRRNRPTVS